VNAAGTVAVEIFLLGVALGLTLGFTLWAGRPAAEVGRFQGSGQSQPSPFQGEGDGGLDDDA
jgi:hypothetical protein